MKLKNWPIALIALIFVGCESMPGLTAYGPPPQGPANMTVTFLPRAFPYEEISESIILPEKPIEKRLVNNISTTTSYSKKGSQEVNPFPTVLFPFDSWEIHEKVYDRLAATANWMHQFPTSELSIEGHTDVRGTESYNMVLGVKRAHAVKQYLVNLGVPSQRLETVSYGKELLVCDIDDDSSCHQFNRRAEIMIE